MKRLLFALLLLMAVPLPAAEPKAASPTIQKLQDISVTIRAGFAQGSGTMFNRKVGDDVITYVWTAAHVVDNLRSTRSVILNGNSRTAVEFEDAQIVQEFKQDGRTIGEIKMGAKVIRFSDATEGEDLALLQVRKKNFVPLETSATFYLDEEIPAIGTELYHVGSLLGQVGANSLTTGVVSQIGRVLELNANGVVFDQTTVTAFPGSSGGGVYLKNDGRYIGMLVRGAGEQFNLIVPARRMRDWAKVAKVEWAMDASVAMPTDEELKKMPVEDSGVSFAPGYPSSAGAPAASRDYPYMLKINKKPNPISKLLGR